ncbi:MAG TPA: hypothetical protein VFR14_06035 [Candidatus Limnocylindrales bacterium]|nr:hypothetical protein [Candidatus Limnocylindrales bacterium]
MQYQASGRASNRRRWPLVVPPLLAVALVAAGLAGRAGEVPPDDGAHPSPSASPIVRWIDCGGVANQECGAAVAAARRALDESFPIVHTATVSPSLICGDSLECPPWFLRDSRSVGSVVLTFVDSPLVAWVNVVEPDPSAVPDGEGDGSAPELLGRLVRAFERS